MRWVFGDNFPYFSIKTSDLETHWNSLTEVVSSGCDPSISNKVTAWAKNKIFFVSPYMTDPKEWPYPQKNYMIWKKKFKIYTFSLKDFLCYFIFSYNSITEF